MNAQLVLPEWPRRSVQDVTRRAVSAITAHLAACEAAQDVTPPAAAALRACGYAAFSVPAELGGVGASLSELAWAQEQLGAAGASLALVVGMNAHVLGSAYAAGSLPAPMLRRLGEAAVGRGTLLNAVASEPNLGSPSRGGLPETALLAGAAPGEWVLSGHKTWATGARALDFALVTAAFGGEVRRVLVEMHAPQVSIESTWWGALALRGSGSQDVYFSNVPIAPADFVPPQEPHPAHPAWFWTALAATYLGVGRAALAALLQYAAARTPTALGAPLSSLPGVQETAGRIQVELSAAAVLLQTAARAFEAQPSEAQLPLLAAAKAHCVQVAVQAADNAARVVGGAALSAQWPFERLLRDSRAGLTHPPTETEAYLRLGRALFDEAARPAR